MLTAISNQEQLDKTSTDFCRVLRLFYCLDDSVKQFGRWRTGRCTKPPPWLPRLHPLHPVVQAVCSGWCDCSLFYPQLSPNPPGLNSEGVKLWLCLPFVLLAMNLGLFIYLFIYCPVSNSARGGNAPLVPLFVRMPRCWGHGGRCLRRVVWSQGS